MQSMTTGAMSAPTNPTVVISFAAACEAANLSISTMRRLVRDDRGPRILKLSDRRIGIRRSDLDQWLASRAS